MKETPGREKKERGTTDREEDWRGGMREEREICTGEGGTIGKRKDCREDGEKRKREVGQGWGGGRREGDCMEPLQYARKARESVDNVCWRW